MAGMAQNWRSKSCTLDMPCPAAAEGSSLICLEACLDKEKHWKEMKKQGRLSTAPQGKTKYSPSSLKQ